MAVGCEGRADVSQTRTPQNFLARERALCLAPASNNHGFAGHIENVRVEI